MKRCALATVFLCATLGVAAATPGDEAAAPAGPVFVIPVKGMIERGLLYVVRRGFAQALAGNSGLIVFDMDTPGGRLDAAEEMIRMLIDLPAEVRTVTYIDKDALSAGALVALATDAIYMAPGSRIGASALVTLTGDIPAGDLKEKAVSATVALVESAARRRGHRVELVEAMIRPDFEYKIGERTICPAGQLLTLSDYEAAETVAEDGRPLLAAGSADTLDELIAALAGPQAAVTRLEVSSMERVARWIEALSVLFLAGGLLGLYIEFKTPGFGLPGILGIVLLAIWFWGHRVAGLAGLGELMLFATGIALLGIEIFLIPGFGFVGLAGIVCVSVAIVMAMVQHYPGGRWLPHAWQVETAVRTFGLTLIFTLAGAALLARLLPGVPMFRRVINAAAEGRNEGYRAPDFDAVLVGREGVALTPLRPAGIGRIGGQRLDVVARGAFVEQGEPIVVAELHGNRIVVDAVKGRG
jgi:membrane-bound serine protease (ClpP class)